LPIIGTVKAPGRETNLVGTANAASEGTIGRQQIANEPILRPGEVLEFIPGLIISQHSGEGKANQYYLRGFQLDHGTDLAGTIDGIPVNMPSHAHGQGYSDINWLIPELISSVTYRKGPYDAGAGDFATAGAYEVHLRGTIAPTLELGAGDYGYGRLLFAGSPRLGAGNLLYALELGHDNGTFVRPDEYAKISGVLRWSRSTASSQFALTAMGYRGDFNSSDQVPRRLVDAGIIPRTGSVDPTDGGRTYRYTLAASWQHDDARGSTRISAFGESSGLDLFSNFTYFQGDAADYYNVHANPITCSVAFTTCVPGPQWVSTYTSFCPANRTPAPFSYSCGDQREQEDKRFVSGLSLTRTLVGTKASATFGAGVRNDNIFALGLFLTNAQNRLPGGTLSNDRVTERDEYAYASVAYRAAAKLRLTAGLRADAYVMNVADFQPANSGYRTQSMLDPKVGAAYAFSPNHELYLSFGEGFHSNDARGTTQALDPQTHAAIDPAGVPVVQTAPLVRAWGEELGYRYAGSKLTSTVALWQLNIASELVFNGDGGVTAPNGPTVRRGIELTNAYRMTPSLALTADIATSTARFLTNANNAGTYVPESPNVVSSAGITWDRPAFSASARYEYFGPRVLDQLGSAVSSPAGIVNLRLSAKRPSGVRLNLDVLNVLNAQSDDVAYFYGSWLPADARNPIFANDASVNPLLGGSGVNDYHVHPTEGRIVRLTYTLPL
jgi:hypothetical protein